MWFVSFSHLSCYISCFGGGLHRTIVSIAIAMVWNALCAMVIIYLFAEILSDFIRHTTTYWARQKNNNNNNTANERNKT